MRRLLAAAMLMVAFGTGCATHPSTPPHPLGPSPTRIRETQPRPPEQPPERMTARTAPGEPAWFPRGGKISPRWTTIVVHHSATPNGGARSFDRYHRNKGWDELGYHFVIGNGTDTPDGMVEVGSRWYKQKHGAHCKTPDNYFNEHGIGICLVGDFTRNRPTQRQLASLERLVGFLCDRCDISPARVVSHGSVTHKTACPGRFLPIATVRHAVASASATSLP